ncbi:MAG: hypothetical protein ACX933_18265 [Marinobacter adhaerens]
MDSFPIQSVMDKKIQTREVTVGQQVWDLEARDQEIPGVGDADVLQESENFFDPIRTKLILLGELSVDIRHNLVQKGKTGFVDTRKRVVDGSFHGRKVEVRRALLHQSAHGHNGQVGKEFLSRGDSTVLHVVSFSEKP